MKSERMFWMAVGVLCSATLVLGASEKSFPFEGAVSANNVYVRSGPDINYYQTTRMMRDQKVQVVGEEFGWYKIVPPEGSYSVVSKDYVEKGEGNKGAITGDRVSIRAGSPLSDRKTSVQMPAGKGMQVTILGEDGDWYKIVPPQGAYLWINAQYVKPVSGKPVVSEKAPVEKEPAKTPAAVTEKTETGPAESAEVGDEELPKELAAVTTRPTSRPSVPGAPKVTEEHRFVIKTTTTRPSPEAMGKFTTDLVTLDKQLLVELKKPVSQQKFDAMIAGFEAIAGQKDNKAAAEFAKNRLSWVKYLKAGQSGMTSLRTLKKEFAAEMSKEVPVMKGDVEPNPAIYRYQGSGMLRPSLVFEGPLMPKRFRLFDPARGRTIAYVELAPNMEINVSQYVGRTVAVYGTSTFDAKLGFKVIQADAFKLLEEKNEITNSPAVID